MRVLSVLALLLLTLLAMGSVASAEHGSGAGGITPHSIRDPQRAH
ncbi:MAG: hypothetical protein JWN15_2638 [Firmicutes bacterium]|nr:hypothetical protein [Bacillota bacterium]